MSRRPAKSESRKEDMESPLTRMSKGTRARYERRKRTTGSLSKIDCNKNTNSRAWLGTAVFTKSQRLSEVGKCFKDPIYKKPYFYGYMPREDVEIILLNQGEFVVRKTAHKVDPSASGFCISVMWDKVVNHVVIRFSKYSTEETDTLMYAVEGPKFKAVSDLIQFYYYTGTPLWKDSEVRLLIPLQRADWVLHQKQLVPIKLIGTGNYGEVWECFLLRYKEDHPEKVAVKCLKGHKVPRAERSAFLAECRRLRQLSHPNMVTFIGMTIDTKPAKMVMQLCDVGLTKYLLSMKGTMSWNEKNHICLQVAQGMEYLSSELIIHRFKKDLAARNCLLKDNIVKIADLGMAREGPFYKMEKSKPLPLKWTAPEAIKYFTFDQMTDVWSYGILVWEVIQDADSPYSELEEKDSSDFCTALLLFLEGGDRLQPGPETPELLTRLMNYCWNMDPEMRPCFAVICALLEEIIAPSEIEDAGPIEIPVVF